ncbi:hypothetical protein HY971_01710 [Candidatus Kaiserbacteria bacterium]|nr:hypothetical protein [Candidatus Kaiserbacteria bacterium]
MSKATPGQARSAPRKRARQRENAAWWIAEAAKAGVTVLKFRQMCAVATAGMGVPHHVVKISRGYSQYELEPVVHSTRSSYAGSGGSRFFGGNYR